MVRIEDRVEHKIRDVPFGTNGLYDLAEANSVIEILYWHENAGHPRLSFDSCKPSRLVRARRHIRTLSPRGEISIITNSNCIPLQFGARRHIQKARSNFIQMQGLNASTLYWSDWPTRFQKKYGRAPRILHIGNIANYAWTNAEMMRRSGAECVILDPDNYHIASAPEWIEANVEGDPGDPFYPHWQRMQVTGFRRPEWFINGPTPFVLRELAAREQNRMWRRKGYAALSTVYRRGLASEINTPSLFRRALESSAAPAVALKAAIRRAILGQSSRSTEITRPAAAESESPQLIDDLVPANLPLQIVREALERFDIVIGYALGARFALAARHPRFASLEIGTLRGLVFEATPLGNLAAEVYKNSPIVFITNVDVLNSAKDLGISPDNAFPIPHPFDLERSTSVHLPAPATNTPVFFAPARHHWTQGNSSWLKGNDVLIRGAAMLAEQGADFRLLFVHWGEDVAESKALIAQHGLTDRTEWIAPQPRSKLWPLIMSAIAIVDQFAASAFGGAALEAMALGRRVISRLDQAHLKPFFETRPPVMSARTPYEVCQQMQSILDDPLDHAGVGAAGQRWMLTEHGPLQQLGRQFEAFERLISRHGPAA